MNQEISSSDRDVLANILTRSGRVATPIQQQTICMKIQIDEDIIFFIGISASDFATQLIHYLNKNENFDALVRLCDLLMPQLGSKLKDQVRCVRANLLPLCKHPGITQLNSNESSVRKKYRPSNWRRASPDKISRTEANGRRKWLMAAISRTQQRPATSMLQDVVDISVSTKATTDVRRLLDSISDTGIRCLEERLRMNPKHWRKADLPMPDARKSHVAKYFEGTADRLLRLYDNLAKLQEDLDTTDFCNRRLVADANGPLDEVTAEINYLRCLLKDVPPHSMAISIEQGVHTVMNNERSTRDILSRLTIAIVGQPAVPVSIKSRAANLIQALILSIENLRNQVQSIAVEVDGEFGRLVTILDGEGDEP